MFRIAPAAAFFFILLSSCIKPHHDFDRYIPPPPPDYSHEDCWAALPWMHSATDTTLPGTGLKNEQDSAKADVFFIYPTLYFGARSWNADVHDAKLNRKIAATAIAQQASVFNGSCRIYIPRYRQATLYSFIDKKGNGAKALDLAYSDIRNAFRYYMKNYNHGRPIIIAGHSQGTVMAYKLVKEFFDTTALRQKLVAAYLIGYHINRDSLIHIPPCDSAMQTGCFISWNSVKWGGLKSKMAKRFSGVCVNPLSWKQDTSLCSDTLNMGSIIYGWGFKGKGIALHGAGAACRNGELWIHNPSKLHIFALERSYHIFDYGLFYMNIRANVAERIKQYLRKNP